MRRMSRRATLHPSYDEDIMFQVGDFSCNPSDVGNPIGVKDNGRRFSTWDHQVDPNSPRNCADFLGGGWWYNDVDCAWHSVNGVYANILWDMGGIWYPIDYVQIVIRHTTA